MSQFYATRISCYIIIIFLIECKINELMNYNLELLKFGADVSLALFKFAQENVRFKYLLRAKFFFFVG